MDQLTATDDGGVEARPHDIRRAYSDHLALVQVLDVALVDGLATATLLSCITDRGDALPELIRGYCGGRRRD